MAFMKLSLLLLTTLSAAVRGAALKEVHHDKPLYPRQSSVNVDLGYEVYQGFYNATTGLNYFLGMRYAQDTSGPNRWQAPKEPLSNRGSVIPATAFPQRCPQGGLAPENPKLNFTGTEDCLFLSVIGPPNATNLPVYVTIHGGGYGEGQGNQDLTALINANNASFVGVIIQYRLAAFGFLSSDEVSRYGTPNAGILDQHFSLQWVQNNIHLFGGDPRQVTISGESAGGGSVMLQVMAYGGTQGTSLFEQAMVQSPYLPMQYGYADFQPSQSYYSFALAAGCFTGIAYGNASGTIFECLVGKDTATLQNASAYVSASGTFGTWAFLPVTDGKFIQQLPSQQLLKGQVNGARLVSGNNANEGPLFVAQDITTEDDLVAFLRYTFPLMSNDTLNEILLAYPSPDTADNPSAPDFATTGVSGPSAINESSFGTGQQQRADNIYAETTFVCPSYWLAEAYAAAGLPAYKYQFSVPPGQHGSDVAVFYGPRPIYAGPDMEYAFMKIFGNFIATGDPSISSAIANGASSAAGDNGTANPASTWPAFTVNSPYQINLNQTGGTLYTNVSFVQPIMNTSYYGEPGLQNDITLVNANTWEAGRGARCELWRSLGVQVPE